MKTKIKYIIGLAAVLLAGVTGCTSILNTPEGKIMGVQSRVFGINIAATTSASQVSPAIQLGLISQTVWIFPTSTNVLYSSPLAATLKVDQSGWNPMAWGWDENVGVENMQTYDGTNVSSQPIVPKLKPPQ